MIETTTDQNLNLFQWQELNNQRQHPHLLILGETGTGKSWLTSILLSILTGDKMVFSAIPFDIEKFDWLRKFPAFYGNAVLPALKAAIAQPDDSKILTVVIDSVDALFRRYPSTIPLVAEGLELDCYVRLLLVAQTDQGLKKQFGIDPSEDLESQFSVIRLGRNAIDFARDPALVNWLKQQQRPCLVDGQPAMMSSGCHA